MRISFVLLGSAILLVGLSKTVEGTCQVKCKAAEFTTTKPTSTGAGHVYQFQQTKCKRFWVTNDYDGHFTSLNSHTVEYKKIFYGGCTTDCYSNGGIEAVLINCTGFTPDDESFEWTCYDHCVNTPPW